MKRAILILSVLAIVLAAALVVSTLQQMKKLSQARSIRRADWESYGYQLLDAPHAQRCALQMTAEAMDPDAVCRVVLNVLDEKDYYFIELTTSGTRIARVEGGFEIPIGTTSKKGLLVGKAIPVVVKRLDERIDVEIEDALAATAVDATLTGGRIGVGAKGNCKVTDVRPIALGDVFCSDDFMRAESENSEWQVVSGTWKLFTLPDPSFSINAFYFVGSGKDGALAVIGQPFWQDYVATVAVRPDTEGKVGLVFYYRDPKNYALFEWDSAQQKNAEKRLVLLRDGRRRVLAKAPGGYASNGTWYQLGARILNRRAIVSIDGNPVLSCQDSSLCGGKVGLFVQGDKEARFDDLRVRNARGFSDDFARDIRGEWTFLGGQWTVTQKDGQPCMTATVQKTGKAVAGSMAWQNYEYDLDLRPGETGDVGACFCYLDEQNYYLVLLEYEKNKAELVSRVEGKETMLGTADVKLDRGGFAHLSVLSDDGRIEIRLDGKPLFETWDNRLRKGQIGMVAQNTSDARFAHVNVRFIAPPKPVLAYHEVFSHEQSMQIWAGPESDWVKSSPAVPELVDPKSKKVIVHLPGVFQWNRTHVMGDGAIEVPVGNLDAKGQTVALAFGKDLGDPEPAYIFSVVRDDAGGRAVLTRLGKIVQQVDLGNDVYVGSVRFRRAGRTFMGYVRNKCVLGYVDPKPVRAVALAWGANGLDINVKDVDVFAENVYNYTFQKAPVEWRPASGEWKVANRWQCDARWSFFSGVSKRLAALWNKRELKGDLVLEFYCGIKMNRARGGNEHDYASDLNATICADGKDLTSGYSFMFGGWGNSKSCIVRGTKIVAETRKDVIPRESIHRRWFYVRVEKHKNKLLFFVDDKKILEYEDPNPLTGTRLAIWTWNNGIMLGRVRISVEDGKKLEPPLPPPPGCKCVYDKGGAS